MATEARYSFVPALIAWAAVSILAGTIISTITAAEALRGWLQAVSWVTFAGALAGVCGRALPSAARLLITLGTGTCGLAWLDIYAYRVANQGVWTLVELAQQEGWAGVVAALEESGIGVSMVLALMLAPFGAGVLFAQFWQAPARWWRTGTTQHPNRWAMAAMAVSIVGIALLPGAVAVPSLTVAFYGPDRIAARFVARGAPPSIQLRDPPPAPRGGASVEALAQDAPKTVVMLVIESLRHDAIDASTMPNLHAFANTAQRLPRARAAANATHPSWYALLHARWSLHWHRLARERAPTALPPPLQAFRDAGYKIHVRSGAGLNYYRVADVTFGAARQLADSYVDAVGCYEAGARDRSQMDRCAIDSAVKLIGNSEARGARSVLLVFLDSTHFPYDWDTPAPKFAPVADVVALRAGAHSDMQAVRNRYRSALWSVDRQVGRLLTALRPLEASGVAIAVTGDHGEEFGEHGKLAHDSELCAVQTRVPLLFRGVGAIAPSGDEGLGSHVDVLPTLLHGVGLARAATALVDGIPLQQRVRRWAFLVHTSAASPYLVALQTATETLEMTVSDRQDVRDIRELFLLQTYRTGTASGVRIGHSEAERQHIASMYGAGLRAVFGATMKTVLRAPAVYLLDSAQAHSAELKVVHKSTWPPRVARPAIVTVRARNTGNVSWLHDVALSYHWLDSAGRPLRRWHSNRRSPLSRATHPGQSVTVHLRVDAAPCPSCAAIAIDLVREHVTWFSEKGSNSPVIWLNAQQEKSESRQ